MTDPAKVRAALLSAIPPGVSVQGEEVPPGLVYVPPAHIRALRLESSLVIGARGVGKSFWTSALTSAEVRTQLATFLPDLGKTDVQIGFSVAMNLERYPTDIVIGRLLTQFDPYHIWLAVFSRWANRLLGQIIVDVNRPWDEAVRAIVDDPEKADRTLERANRFLESKGQFALILFDALDRSCNDWQTMDTIVRGLLRAVLKLQGAPRLKAKVFLREDQWDRTVTNFPDASKLYASRAELTWEREDLHGMLWQFLINAPDGNGEFARTLFRQVTNMHLNSGGARWYLPREVESDAKILRTLFEAVAGKYMGTDQRRGIPYVWIVSHLADARRRTSPRSFLAALRIAAEDSVQRYPQHPHGLHYESIKRGVQEASAIRIQEIAEDYPWVRSVMDPLKGQTVPCEFRKMSKAWDVALDKGLKDKLKSEGLPPARLDEGSAGLKEDLIRIGVLEETPDGRINMPDLYRIGFGLGRKGGVRPIKRN